MIGSTPAEPPGGWLPLRDGRAPWPALGLATWSCRDRLPKWPLGGTECPHWKPGHFARFAEIVQLVHRLGEDPERWSWLDEEDPDVQIEVAAEVLGIPAAELAANFDLLEALRLE